MSFEDSTVRNSRCVMVLGLPRSGTSLVAGILHMTGVNMGEGRLQPADQNNPTGYWEDLRWQALNKRITGIRYGCNEPRDIGTEQKEQYRQLAAECQTRPLWGMKDPRLCFTAQWIWPYLSDCRIVTVRRDFEASVASLVKHSQVSYKRALEMGPERARALLRVWREAMDRRLAEFEGPVLPVEYELLLKEPNEGVRALRRFAHDSLGVAWPSNKQIDAAIRFVAKELNHNG